MITKILNLLRRLIDFLFGVHDATVPTKRTKTYHYKHKDFIMTRTEAGFYKLLLQAASDEYHVYPQVHLSAIIDHKVEGQNWKPAFRHINGKSVDFVVCDKQNFRPLVAIELDDSSHDRYSRRLRDEEVERIFDDAHLRLVRFTVSRSYSVDEIIKTLNLVES